MFYTLYTTYIPQHHITHTTPPPPPNIGIGMCGIPNIGIQESCAHTHYGAVEKPGMYHNNRHNYTD
jgi:hypothetical protein